MLDREELIKEIDKWLAAVQPRVVLGDENSIYLTEWQYGYRSALLEVKGKLLGAGK